jgi:predicted nucleic acid-binding protein
LFQKEGDPTKGIPYWQLAKSFIERVMFSANDEIVYSGVILRELQIKLGEQVYQEKRHWFEEELKFSKVDAVNDDKVAARKLESHYNFEISFYDLVHTMLAKRLSLVLVTRDEQLLKIAREQGVRAHKPEEL